MPPAAIQLNAPVDASIVADLAPLFRVRRAPTTGGSLRVIEGGEGPPLVLLHGRGSAATMWYPLLRTLAASFRVLSIDLPGYGQSTGYRFEGRGFEAGLDFFTRPIEELLLAEGLGEAAIVGHSLGGFIALELSLRGRVAPRGLGLVASMGLAPAAKLAARMFFHLGPERIARLVGPARFAKILPPEKTADGPRLAALVYELYTTPGGRPDAAAAFDQLAPRRGPAPHRGARLGELKPRTLVLWGDDDEVLPSPVAIAAAAAIPRAELRIEPLGHSPHLQAPERVIPIFERFFRV